MKAIIETSGLCKQYDRVCRVKDLDLLVPEGIVYGFLGPNGAGKSTTLKMLLGLAKPSNGEIKIFGTPFSQRTRLDILKNVGALIESPSYYGHLTGEENLKIMQRLLDVPRENIGQVLQIVRLEKQKDKKVSHYSLGMKQRLGLATALLGFPKLLILDEPTNGLDPAGIQEMRELIISLPKAYGMTVVVSSHLLSEIDQIAGQAGIINHGELVFQDSLDCLHSRSSNYLAFRTRNNQTAGEILREIGVPFTSEGAYLLTAPLDDDQVAFCGHRLMEAGADICRIEERKKSLEDIFLELTGRAVSL